MISQSASSAPQTTRRQQWLDRYVLRTSPWLSALALVYLVTWSIEAIWWDPQALWFTFLSAFGISLWALFATDLLLRFVVTPNRRGFFRQNLLDTITVVIPQFRALRVLRIFTKQGLVSGKTGLLSGGALATAAMATVLVVWIGSLMVLNAERGAANAEITNLGSALWWCLQTVTTVGYGDVLPVTPAGRVLAVLVMMVGISVVGSVSASFAATLIKQRPTASNPTPDGAQNVQSPQDPGSDLRAELADLKAMVSDLQATLSRMQADRPPAAT